MHEEMRQGAINQAEDTFVFGDAEVRNLAPGDDEHHTPSAGRNGRPEPKPEPPAARDRKDDAEMRREKELPGFGHRTDGFGFSYL